MRPGLEIRGVTKTYASGYKALHGVDVHIPDRRLTTLLGPSGCGKTTLCRRFLNELDSTKYDTALILNPRVTETQMLKAILTELGETRFGRSQNDLVAQMNKVLSEELAKSARRS